MAACFFAALPGSQLLGRYLNFPNFSTFPTGMVFPVRLAMLVTLSIGDHPSPAHGSDVMAVLESYITANSALLSPSR
jgi:hypothetical protein